MADDSISGHPRPAADPSEPSQSPLEIALAYHAGGLTPLPHLAGYEHSTYYREPDDVASIAWGAYKVKQPDRATVEAWFRHSTTRDTRIELLTGTHADPRAPDAAFLQILDFESAEVWEDFQEQANYAGLADVLYRCVIERTPSGGAHVGFLCPAIADKPKLKLAVTKDAEGREKLLIELLQHHLCTVAPTAIAWKPDRPEGACYQLIQGTWAQPYAISIEQRQALIDLCRIYNEVPEQTVDKTWTGEGNGNRRGDKLNASVDATWWLNLLATHGWKDVSRGGKQGQGVYYFQRPGKQGFQCSATYGRTGHCLYVFSSNAQPFEPDTAYTPFTAYALLEHDGDFAAAGRALAKQFPATKEELEAFRKKREAEADDLITEQMAQQAAPDLDDSAEHLQGMMEFEDGTGADEKDGGVSSQQEGNNAQPDADVPLIRLTKLSTAASGLVDSAQRALLALPYSPVLFQRAHRLCVLNYGARPVRWLRRDPDAPTIAMATLPRVRELVCSAAIFLQMDLRSDKWVETHPPKWLIENLMARPSWPFPALEGLLTTPTLRPDGSVLDSPGYDEATGLFYSPNGMTFPLIPSQPTKDDARNAIEALKEVVQDVPFADTWGASAWLAAVLSIACRNAIQGNVPMFAVTGPTPGSGKGLLCMTIGIIGTGYAPGFWSQARDEAEDEKRLLAIAMAGDRVVCMDNVTRKIESAPLAKTLTTGLTSGRILGATEKVDVPSATVFLCNGNNTEYSIDIGRRVVPIVIDPMMERPEERSNFKHQNLLKWVRAERGRLAAAALTVMKAFFEAGCPAQSLSALGSFEEWNALIRQALVWTGEPDPCEGRKALAHETSPEYEALSTLLHAWEACYPIIKGQARGIHVTAGELLEAIARLRAMDKPSDIPGKPPTPNNYDALQAALGAYDKKYDGKSLGNEIVGKALRSIKGKVIGTRRLVIDGEDRQHRNYWALEEVRGGN
jgi:hypothetical protein